MKTNVMPSIVRIEKEELSKLMSQVDETLATNLITKQQPVKRKRFGVVDLWNCQRNMRRASIVR